MNVHRSIIQNRQKIETLQMSSNRSTDKPMWYIHMMEYYSAIKRNSVLRRITARCMLELTGEKPSTKGYVLYDSIYVKCSEQANLQKRSTLAVVRGWGVGRRHSDNECFFLGWRKGSGISVADVCTTLWVHWKPLNCILQRGWFYDLWIISTKIKSEFQVCCWFLQTQHNPSTCCIIGFSRKAAVCILVTFQPRQEALVPLDSFCS